MKYTAYGTQKFPWICIISSLTPVPNAWNEILGIYMYVGKETVWKICLTKIQFQQHKQPNSHSPNYDELYKLRPVLDYMNKKILSIPMCE